MEQFPNTSTSTGRNSFKTCSFCPTDKLEQELYKCPKCRQMYCSIRCFRSKKHENCSEDFFQKQCSEYMDEVNSSKKTNENTCERPITTFEQYMEKNEKTNPKLDEKQVNPEFPLSISEDEEILFDSDDEPEYLGNIIESTMNEFESLDDEELDRKLTAIGLPIGVGTSKEENHEKMEKLYQQLNDEEKKKFVELAEGIHENQFQAYTNCFKKKKC